MTRAVRWAFAALLVCGAVVTTSAANAQTAEADSATAAVDSVGAAVADTTETAPTGPALQGLARQEISEPAEARPLVVNWTHKPRAGLTAEVRLWRYFFNWDDNLAMRAGSSATTRLGYAVDTYRRQQKEIETRDKELAKLVAEERDKLEQVAGLTVQQAKDELVKGLENEARLDADQDQGAEQSSERRQQDNQDRNGACLLDSMVHLLTSPVVHELFPSASRPISLSTSSARIIADFLSI